MSEQIKLSWKHLASNRGNQHVVHIPEENRSSAPYNFVPLNEDIAYYAGNQDDLVDHSTISDEHFSGEISATIETLTPLFIGSSKEGTFFSPQNIPIIPGSTLRGMLRELVSILSYGKVTQVDKERKLFARAFMDQAKGLEVWYKQHLSETRKINGNRYTFTKALGGYLQYNPRSDVYSIVPAKKSGNDTWRRIRHQNLEDAMGGALQPFTYHSDPLDDYSGSWLVVSGPMDSKRHEYIINPLDNNAEPIPIKPQLRKDYEADCEQAESSRSFDGGNNTRYKLDINLLKWAKEPALRALPEGNEYIGVPVFYITDSQGNIIAFGSAPFFRLPYNKTIGNHLYGAHTDETSIDLAERMFGIIADDKTNAGDLPKIRKTGFGGHIKVGNAVLQEPGDDKFLDPFYLTLMGPKSTTFQHYLVQTSPEVRDLKTWNDGVPIRGIKMYWHKSVDTNTTETEDTDMNSKLRPLKQGVRFNFSIQFENLTSIELGALLTALQLKKGMAHKIGMGKPLGYGSALITDIELQLIGGKTRYKSLIPDGVASAFNLGIKPGKVETFVEDFQNLIVSNVSNYERDNQSDFWSLKRMQEVKAMMTYPGDGAFDQKIYLPLNAFRSRKILPRASVVGRVTNATDEPDLLERVSNVAGKDKHGSPTANKEKNYKQPKSLASALNKLNAQKKSRKPKKKKRK